MPKLNQQKLKAQIQILDQLDNSIVPAKIPSASQLNTMAKSYSMEIIKSSRKSLPNKLGFNLNANHPVESMFASLVVPYTPILVTNSNFSPYYYHFNEWARMFMDNPPEPRYPGKIIVRFNNNFKITNGIVFLSLGGYTNAVNLPSGFKITIGKKQTFYQLKNLKNNLAAQIIPICYYSKYSRPLKMEDILIESFNLESWKFFSASYNPLYIVNYK